MIEQRSPEWFQQRRSKLTGSIAGAALGVNPWMTPEQVIRQMVREHHGAKREFTGNIATDYGTEHEPLALMDYLGKTGNLVEECGVFFHPDHEWLGASPDGLIDDDAVIEVKCPFGLRNKEKPEFKTATEQPHYYAQMQVEMACTGRVFCHFYQWAPRGDFFEFVTFDPKWWDENLPKLREFYEWFLSEIDNPEHLEPLIKEVNTKKAKSLLDAYDQACAEYDDAAARKKDILAELVDLSGNKNAVLFGRKLTEVWRKGSVAYAKVVSEKLPELDLEPYRGKSTKFWKLS